jgi:hypothetical protein
MYSFQTKSREIPVKYLRISRYSTFFMFAILAGEKNIRRTWNAVRQSPRKDAQHFGLTHRPVYINLEVIFFRN